MASKAPIALQETVLDPDSGRIYKKGKFLGKARTFLSLCVSIMDLIDYVT